MKKIILSLLFVLIALPAIASQNATTLSTTSPYAGLTMLNDINAAFDTFQTNFSGASAPSNPKTYQLWTDTSNSLLKVYNGSSWVVIGKLTSSGWQSVNNGVASTFPASTGSANAYVVTYSPAVTTLVTGQAYPFIASFANTGAATVKINGIGPYPLTKQGAVALSSGDIPNGLVVYTVFDGTEFQIVGTTGNATAGTVTAISTANGVTGGPITASGTISLAAQANNTILSNISGGSAAPTGNSVSNVLDSVGSAQGDLLTRTASGWVALPPSTAGTVLTSGGSGANVSWQGVLPSQTNNSGKYLTTNGTSASWGAISTGFTSCTQVTAADSASCPSGYTLTGGGCNVSNAEHIYGLTSLYSYPNSSSWSCGGSYWDGNAIVSAQATAYSVCCH